MRAIEQMDFRSFLTAATVYEVSRAKVRSLMECICEHVYDTNRFAARVNAMVDGEVRSPVLLQVRYDVMRFIVDWIDEFNVLTNESFYTIPRALLFKTRSLSGFISS